jgi:outer membrane murein-binding lipoprotein Lpp
MGRQQKTDEAAGAFHDLQGQVTQLSDDLRAYLAVSGR